MRVRAGVALIGVMLGLVAVPSALAAPGDFDESFSGDGKVTTGLKGETLYATAVAVQPDGKILVAGGTVDPLTNDDPTGEQSLVARYTKRGKLDKTFGNKGIELLPAAAGPISSDLVLRPDGTIVVVTRTVGFQFNGAPATSDFTVARLTSRGVLDATFGSGGLATIDVGGYDSAFAATGMSDGSIVVGGEVVTEIPSTTTPGGLNTRYDFALVRLTAAGALDPAFSGDGIASGLGTATPSLNTVTDLVEAGSGVVAGASALGKPTLAAFSATGELDPAFPAGGVPPAPFGGAGLVRLADGKFLVAGAVTSTVDKYPDPQVAQINADGSLDTTYGDGGTVKFNARSDYADPTDLAVDSRGRAIVGALLGGYEAMVIRLTADGKADKSFSGHGQVVAGFGGYSDDAAVAVAPDGKIVLAGERLKASKTSIAAASGKLAVARLEVKGGRRGADADADGLADDRDVCPQIHGAGHRGCPLVKTFLVDVRTERVDGKPAIEGEVESDSGHCVDDVIVTAYEKVRGRDPVAGKTKTKFDIELGPGGFAIRGLAPGQYYAAIRAHDEPNAGRCAADRSAVVTVGR